LNTSDFDYDLPQEYIAQHPLEPRDAARLMVLHRSSGKIEHTHFAGLGKYLDPGDVLVINRTRVIPARLFAHKLPGRGRVEILLLKKAAELDWEVLVGGKGLKAGRQLEIEGGPQAEVLAVLDGPKRIVRFAEPIENFYQKAGHIPLPPYITEHLADPERYQTVFAQESGSAAAPTAGLHFTPELMGELSAQGVILVSVTLHIGLDTFAPVNEARPEQHKIHTEWCHLSQQAADQINAARRGGNRIIAVGTTSVRTLETAAQQANPGQVVAPFSGPTALYILPGYTFRAVDALITNFHLPKSTLIMLVSAFAGRETILNAYETAKENGYRFYSFGDAMLIV
jgi:S-adenosylmethionine:tRNA ribosyltransferase-isomerase